MKEPVTLHSVKHPRYRWRVTWTQAGEYHQKYFKHGKKQDAEDLVEEKRIEILNEGRKNGAFSPSERRAIHRAREEFQRYEGRKDPPSLEKAIDFYLVHIEATRKSIPVVDLVDKRIETARKEGKSKRYLQDLDSRLNRFAAAQKGKMAAEVTLEDIDAWLLSQAVSGVTHANNRRVLIGLFNYAVDHGYCDHNPALKAAKKKVQEHAIEVLAPTQASDLLTHCDETILPAIAIQLFAGVRREEVMRLDWQDVDLHEGHIEIKPSKSKTAKRRLIKVRDNLKAWLQPYAKKRGPIVNAPREYQTKWEQGRGDAGITVWPHNAMRHSFASYALAQDQNADALALEMGHDSTKLIFSNYRKVVTPKAALSFWNLSPGTQAKVASINRAS